MLRAANLLVMLNRIAGRNPDSIKKIEEFLARDLEVTAPLAIEVAIEEGDPMGRALANVLLRHADLGLAMLLYPRLPAQSVSLKEAAAIVAAQIASATEQKPGLALTLVASTKIRLARCLSGAGRHDEAAVELQQVVESLEQLYLRDSEGAERFLATAQVSYAETLHELGRRDEALTDCAITIVGARQENDGLVG
jgi:tetratricopeptide (TPR) repeat protein